MILDKQAKMILDQMEASDAPPLYKLPGPDVRARVKEGTIAIGEPKIRVCKKNTGIVLC